MANMMNPADYLTTQERKELLKKSNWKGWLQVIEIWGYIAAAMALVTFFPNILTQNSKSQRFL